MKSGKFEKETPSSLTNIKDSSILTNKHKHWIVAALAISTVRLILRTILVVISESAIVIPIVCSALLCIVILI